MSAAFEYCATQVEIAIVTLEFNQLGDTQAIFALPETFTQLSLSYELLSETDGTTIRRVGRSKTDENAEFCVAIPALTNAICLAIRLELSVKQCCNKCCVEERVGNAAKECVSLKCCTNPDAPSVPKECCYGDLGQNRTRKTARCITRRYKGTLVKGVDVV